MDIDNEKASLFNQENSDEEESIKLKIYNFFYTFIKPKKEFHHITLIILTILEMIQLISYAFSEPHINTWNFTTSTKKYISLILGAVRIAPLMQLTNYYTFAIILIIIIAFIIIFTILFFAQLLYVKITSKIFSLFIYFMQITANSAIIFTYIPLTEIMLMPLKCVNDYNYFFQQEAKCWTAAYWLYVIFGIFGSIILFCSFLFILFFYFSPFPNESSSIRMNSFNDIFLLIAKLIIIIRFLFVKNEYLSIIILLLLSIYLLFSEFSEETYSNNVLETVVNIRNCFVFWTYFMLLISKFAENTKFKKIYFLLLLGYPIITFLTITKFKLKEYSVFNVFGELKNEKVYLKKTRIWIKLIDSFIENGKNLKYGNELKNQKDDLLIRGIIKIHTKKCINEECPLTKFTKNPGNFSIQKQCLLNGMTIHFNSGIKTFPLNPIIKIYYIQFNFSHRFNLNSVRTNLNSLRKIKTNINVEYIIFCLEQEIKIMENKSNDNNDSNEAEFELDLLEQKYRRLKFLIENITKLYVEFWGIFTVNITNNLNSDKLYTIGEKLNKYSKEIKFLWENELKDKKIDINHQGIIQLYSRFLKEILWDQKRSAEILEKINEVHYNQYEIKINNSEKFQLNNINALLENQDYLIFANSNEKGKCNIVQCSNSITYLLGYEKSEIIGKPIEILMPDIFIDGHKAMLEERIKIISLEKNKEKDSFRDSNKKLIFIPVKNKMGYIVPLNAKFTLYDDNDYSNSFIIKTKFELKDSKSLYPYYIITKDDFTVDSISSSAINLGLTMDLLKKHVIKLNLLIRSKKSEIFNLLESYNNYKDEPKAIEWIYPYLIYPKDNVKRNMLDNLNELIKKSPKKLFNLQIDVFKYDENNILGYSFKFTEINKKNFNKIIPEKCFPTKRQEFIFDLLTMKYIRTIIVDKKSGFRNFRDNLSQENEGSKKLVMDALKGKRRKKYENQDFNEIKESSSENEHIENLLTKENILELQTKDSNEIKQFIFSLPFHGFDISMEKFRPNKAKYSVGKSTEPSIKIQLSKFTKKIEKRVKLNELSAKTINRNENNINTDNNKFYDSNNNYLDQSSQKIVNDIKKNENRSKEIFNDISNSLSKFFQEKSINYISIMSFCIFLFVCFFTTLEFCINYNKINTIKSKIIYVEDAYKLLNGILYTKYFVTESVISNELENRIGKPYIYVTNLYNGIKKLFNEEMKNELAKIRQEMTEITNIFTENSDNFPKEFKKFMTDTNLKIQSKNGEIIIQLSNALSRIINNIFYLCSVAEGNFEINMSDSNTYELMKNLLNDYFISWQKATSLLIIDAQKNSAQSRVSLIILILSLIISILFLVLFWKLIYAFSLSREKPIILILTIKKKIFENLKNSAENFSNKLLNKFFGNEEIEEESKQDYQINIQTNDVNIAKFKSPSVSINKNNSYVFLLIHLLLFFIVVEIYFLLKYIFININYSNLYQYIEVFNSTEYSHTFTILAVNIEKSYFLNRSHPILSQGPEKNKQILFDVFYNITGYIKDNQITTSVTNCFLKHHYVDKFEELFYRNYTEIIHEVYVLRFSSQITNGIKPIIMRIFENLKYLFLLYYQNFEIYDKNDTIILINDRKFLDLNFSFQNFLRNWYNGICQILSKELQDYVSNIKLMHIIIYIVIVFFVTLYYTFVWRNYLEKLENLLKKSRDLINLIPEEIKYIIVTKLNE